MNSGLPATEMRARRVRGPSGSTADDADKHPRLAPEMLMVRLSKLANLLSRPFFGRFAKEQDLTLNEWRCIVALAGRPGSAAQDISAVTGLHPMNISRALTGLRESGRIEEARDPNNHRRTLLWLAPAGEHTFRQIAPHAERQAEMLLHVLSVSDQVALGRIVDRLVSRAEEITSELP